MDEWAGCGSVVALPAGNANSNQTHTMSTEITTATSTLPMSVAYSHSLSDALYEAGCKSPSDFSIVQMSGGYGDCLILHTEKALAVWNSVPKNYPDKCAKGYGAGSGMYIRD